MTTPLRLLGLLATLGPVTGAIAGGTLLPNSPFAAPDASTAVVAENQPLELRGILMDGAGYRYSIYDPAKKTGQWVRINEPGHDFTIKSHDIPKDMITLDYQGRVLTLALRSGKVVGTAVPELPPGPHPTITPNSARSGPPEPKPTTPEDAARFNRAVEEINRRRSQREKGLLPTPGTASGDMIRPPGPPPK